MLLDTLRPSKFSSPRLNYLVPRLDHFELLPSASPLRHVAGSQNHVATNQHASKALPFLGLRPNVAALAAEHVAIWQHGRLRGHP